MVPLKKANIPVASSLSSQQWESTLSLCQAPWTQKGQCRSCYNPSVIESASAATASAGCQTLRVPGRAPHLLEAGQQCCVTARAGAIVPTVFVDRLIGKPGLTWQGINSPVCLSALLQQVRSGRDEAPHASNPHPDLLLLHPGHSGT